MSETTGFLYTDYSTFLSRHFEGKVQKLSIDGGFGCPNRDGTIGKGGCTYCNNATFTPSYCLSTDAIRSQIEKGKSFFRRKYPKMQFLAYFQAHTNTYAPLDILKLRYEEALSVDGIVGIIIGTRPDCISKDLLEYLEQLSRKTFVLLEFGIETTDDTLLRYLNRGHTFQTAADAIRQCAAHHLHTAGHIILGLPGQTHEMMMEEPARLSALPLEILKLHQLQIVRNTTMEKQYREAPESFHCLYQTPQDYANEVAEYIQRLRKDIVLERFTSQSPKEWLIAPQWGMKNYEFVELLKQTLRSRNAYQGKLFV